MPPTGTPACGPLVPCGGGLTCDPLAGFVCVSDTVDEGQACGPLVQCGPGLFCDPIAGFRCVDSAGVDEACGPGVPCQDGLACTAALLVRRPRTPMSQGGDAGNLWRFPL